MEQSRKRKKKQGEANRPRKLLKDNNAMPLSPTVFRKLVKKNDTKDDAINVQNPSLPRSPQVYDTGMEITKSLQTTSKQHTDEDIVWNSVLSIRYLYNLCANNDLATYEAVYRNSMPQGVKTYLSQIYQTLLSTLTIHSLPAEILWYIFSTHLKPNNLLPILLTCKKWKSLLATHATHVLPLLTPSLRNLKYFPKIHHLHLRNLAPGALRHLEYCTALQTLNLTHATTSDTKWCFSNDYILCNRDAVHIARCTTLTALSLANVPTWTSEAGIIFQNCTKINSLRIECTKNPGWLGSVSQCRGLTHLALMDCTLSAAHVGAITRLTNLEVLTISSERWYRPSRLGNLEKPLGLPKLRELKVDLEENFDLENLVVPDNALISLEVQIVLLKSVSWLRACPNLKTLGLRASMMLVSENDIMEVVTKMCPNLETLIFPLVDKDGFKIFPTLKLPSRVKLIHYKKHFYFTHPRMLF